MAARIATAGSVHALRGLGMRASRVACCVRADRTRALRRHSVCCSGRRAAGRDARGYRDSGFRAVEPAGPRWPGRVLDPPGVPGVQLWMCGRSTRSMTFIFIHNYVNSQLCE